jgi:large subunit ribosomal protein LP1
MADIAQLACTYAALILYDDGQDITGDKIAALVSAAGVKVDSYWPKLFAKAVEGQNIASFFNFGGQSASSGSAPAPVAVTEAPKV